MKERDNIEELIFKNIDSLNDSEPLEGHFARFEKKLQQQKKPKKKLTLNMVLKIAAAVVFVLLASNQAFIYFSPEKDGNTQNSPTAALSLASVSEEYGEVEFYYTTAINSGIQNWNKLKEAGLISEEEQMMMDKELQEFEGLYQSLQNDLNANPNDERIINAMLDYYQAKLSVLNLIINKLEQAKEKEQTSKKTSSLNL